MADLSNYVERLNEMVATTYRNIDTDIADLIKRNNAFYTYLDSRGCIEDFEGGHGLQEPIIVPSGVDTTNYYGYDTFQVAPNTHVTAAMYTPVQKVRTVMMSMREFLENRGPEAYISLWDARVKAELGELMNSVSRELTGDGSGYQSIGGLQLLVSDNPATSIVGDIDASQYAWWRNIANGVTVQLTEANIEENMDKVISQLYIAGDLPNCIVADNNLFYMLKRRLTNVQRIDESKVGDLGFMTLKYQGIDVILDGGYQGTASDGVPVGGVANMHMYFLNSNYIKLKCFKSGDSKASSVRFGDVLQVPGQDAISMSIYWFGQLTCNKRSAQGVLYQGTIV